MTESDTNETNQIEYVSKSQKKRDALALQDLGRHIIALKAEVIRKLPLSNEVQTAIIAAKTMKMGALKRQVQYIGKLLRKETDLATLNRALAVYFK